MIRYSLYIFLSGATILLVNKIDNMMIGALGKKGLADLAVYTVAFFIGTVIVIPGRAIRQIAAPIVADAWEKNDIKEVNKVYKKTALNQLIVGAVVLIVIWLNIDNLLSFLPQNYFQGKFVILFIGLSRLIRMGMGVNKQVLRVSRYYRYEFWGNLLLIALVIGTNYLLIPIYGINGAALATLISFFVRNLFVYLVVLIKLKLQPFTRHTVKAVIVALVAYVAGHQLPEMSLIIDIVMRSLTIITIYGTLVLTWGFAPDINDIVNKGWGQLKKHLNL